MNIYSQQDQQCDSQDEQSQISWSRIHKSSLEIKYTILSKRSKKINKRQPQEIQKKWFSLRKISSCREELQEKKDMDLRDQTCYDFDYLQLDKDLLANKNSILAIDRFTGRTLIIKVASLQSEIIEVCISKYQKLFQLDYNNIITPENIYTYSVQSHKIDDLAKEIKIVNLSFSLLLFEYCPISLAQGDFTNKQIKTIFLDLISGLISARKANLQLKSLSINSILYSEEKGGYKLQDYTDSIVGNNVSNMKELGECLAQMEHSELRKIAQEMINSEKPFEELREMLEKFE